MIIGIDNGLTGGIVALSPIAGLPPVASFVMPTIEVWHPNVTKTTKDNLTGKTKKSKGKFIKEVDTRKLIGILDSIQGPRDSMVVYFEQCPMHADQAITMRSMAMSAGKILAILEAKCFQVVRVMSHDWHPSILGKFPRGESKSTAAAVAATIWPDEKWFPTGQYRTPHSGLIDAALIAEYGRRAQNDERTHGAQLESQGSEIEELKHRCRDAPCSFSIPRGGFEALCRPWEHRLDALYQCETPPLDVYRYWFGEADRNASDTMRQIARQNASLKLHDALIARIQGDESPSEMSDLLAWHQRYEAQCGSTAPSEIGTASQEHRRALGVDQSAGHSSVVGDSENSQTNA